MREPDEWYVNRVYINGFLHLEMGDNACGSAYDIMRCTEPKDHVEQGLNLHWSGPVYWNEADIREYDRYFPHKKLIDPRTKSVWRRLLGRKETR